MKKVAAVLGMLLCLCLVGCSSTATITTKLAAAQICEQMQKDGLPITHVFAYMADNDTNKLLGKPNQYTSKVSFVDNRYSGDYDEASKESDFEAAGFSYIGTIEVFDNKDDMQKRYDYVNGFIKQGGIWVQYIYNTDTAILRLDTDLTSDQAKEYQ